MINEKLHILYGAKLHIHLRAYQTEMLLPLLYLLINSLPDWS